MRLFIILYLGLSISCSFDNSVAPTETIVFGQAPKEAGFMTLGKDTITIKEGVFRDTLYPSKDLYNYIKFEHWKWPRIIYLKAGTTHHLQVTDDEIKTNSAENNFLLNRDSILVPYTSRWDMSEADFRNAWQTEMPLNLRRIDSYFKDKPTHQNIVDEIKQMEYMLRGHLTANFISFQEKRGNLIDRNIYHFVDSIDLNNDRLGFHVNNRNFQYYYYLDRVNRHVPDSIHPFAVIDTVSKYVKVKSIREMIIKGAVRSGLNDDSVNHDALFEVYKKQFGEIKKDDIILQIYDQIQQLQPGKPAPGFGKLRSLDGQTYSLENFNGSNILIAVWGTWCPYCKEELPHLQRLVNRYSNKLKCVAISLDKDASKWKEYIEENDWEGIHLIDSDSNSDFRQNYMISGTNVYYLIDRKGMIVATKIAPSSNTLDAMIQALD